MRSTDEQLESLQHKAEKHLERGWDVVVPARELIELIAEVRRLRAERPYASTPVAVSIGGPVTETPEGLRVLPEDVRAVVVHSPHASAPSLMGFPVVQNPSVSSGEVLVMPPSSPAISCQCGTVWATDRRAHSTMRLLDCPSCAPNQYPGVDASTWAPHVVPLGRAGVMVERPGRLSQGPGIYATAARPAFAEVVATGGVRCTPPGGHHCPTSQPGRPPHRPGIADIAVRKGPTTRPLEGCDCGCLGTQDEHDARLERPASHYER